jgi:hypothetical protein
VKFCVILPGYFPDIPVFAKALAVDVIVWADSFAFNKHSDINRAIIKTIAGPKWLTAPVLSGHLPGYPISMAQIDNHSQWQRGHRRSITMNYKNAAYYNYYHEELESLFSRQWTNLEELLWNSFVFLARELQIKVQIIKSSTLPDSVDRSDRVLAWGKELSCDGYLYPDDDKILIEQEKIKQGGMQLYSHSLTPFSYFQQFNDILFPLSALDLVLNEGETAPAMIKKNNIITEA